MMRRFVALAVLFVCACTSVARQEELDSKEARWKSTDVDAPSDRVLWQLTLLSLQNQGYPLGAATDPGAREVESGWKTDMQPFKGEGQRRRAVVRMKPLEPGKWHVEARVMTEHNENLTSPLDPTRAEWRAAADDETSAQVLLQHIRARLSPELPTTPAPTTPKKPG